MERIENECVDCGLPCLGDACPYRNVRRLYCDRCDSEAEMLYKVEGLGGKKQSRQRRQSLSGKQKNIYKFILSNSLQKIKHKKCPNVCTKRILENVNSSLRFRNNKEELNKWLILS